MTGRRDGNPSGQKQTKVWAYAYMPILYMFLAVLVIGAVTYPYWGVIRSAVQVFSSDVTPNMTELTSIFLPTQPPQTPETDEPGAMNPAPQGDTVDNSVIEIPNYNTQYAQLRCDAIGLDCPLYFGDSDAALAMGAGQYHGSWLPGYGGTILVAGHNTSFFANFPDLEIGDIFQITTNYGVYEYSVTDMQIHNYQDKSAFDLTSREREVLVLYTCVGLFGGSKDDRLFVYCDKISGPTVVGLEVSQ